MPPKNKLSDIQVPNTLKIYSIPLCHGLPDRTIYFRNKAFPLCARCTGTLIGVFTLPIYHMEIMSPSIGLIVLFASPAIVDAFTQLIGFRESNNKLRLITGFLLGASLSALIVISGKILVNMILNR
ncbi:MAG: DUF2085 domain-containing protein [Methanobacteriaceae archaeon]|nr:DUF2085 domain-containing protein [Methanobacteriaceae archaeon]